MSGNKRPCGEPSKIKKHTESGSSSVSPFLSDQPKCKFNILRKKNVNSCRLVVTGDFDHLNLAQNLEPHKLRYFLSIKEPIYQNLVIQFYCTLHVDNNIIVSKVGKTDLKLHLDVFVNILKLPCAGVDIFEHNLLS